VIGERDAVQKKTFTKWINKHLVKVTHHQYINTPVCLTFTLLLLLLMMMMLTMFSV